VWCHTETAARQLKDPWVGLGHAKLVGGQHDVDVMAEARFRGDLLLLLLLLLSAVGQDRKLGHRLKRLSRQVSASAKDRHAAARDAPSGCQPGVAHSSFRGLIFGAALARPQGAVLTATPCVGKTSWGNERCCASTYL